MKKFKTFSEEIDLSDFEEDVTCVDKTEKDKNNSAPQRYTNIISNNFIIK